MAFVCSDYRRLRAKRGCAKEADKEPYRQSCHHSRRDKGAPRDLRCRKLLLRLGNMVGPIQAGGTPPTCGSPGSVCAQCLPQLLPSGAIRYEQASRVFPYGGCLFDLAQQ